MAVDRDEPRGLPLDRPARRPPWTRIRAIREERNRTAELFRNAKAAVAESETDSAVHSAAETKRALDAVDARLEEASQEQLRLLRTLGDMEHGRSGFSSPGHDGWLQASRELDLAKGHLRVDVPGTSLMQAALNPATLPPTPVDARIGLAAAPPAAPGAAPVSNKWLYPVVPQVPFAPNDLSATDFVVTFEVTAVSGVERAPAATTAKAEISPTVTFASPTEKTFAVVLDAVPVKIFDSQQALRSLLSNELSRQIDTSVDAHVVGAIQAASPPTSSTGTGLVWKVRNGIAAMSDVGSSPTVLALSPSDAADLDLSVDGNGSYVFRVDSRGSGSPVWSVLVRETPELAGDDPLLLDVGRLGVLYTGSGSIVIDPYGDNLRHNLVAARVELGARAHVRDILGALVLT